MMVGSLHWLGSLRHRGRLAACPALLTLSPPRQQPPAHHRDSRQAGQEQHDLTTPTTITMTPVQLTTVLVHHIVSGPVGSCAAQCCGRALEAHHSTGQHKATVLARKVRAVHAMHQRPPWLLGAAAAAAVNQPHSNTQFPSPRWGVAAAAADGGMPGACLSTI